MVSPEKLPSGNCLSGTSMRRGRFLLSRASFADLSSAFMERYAGGGGSHKYSGENFSFDGDGCIVLYTGLRALARLV
jgi:hypothetical protein